MMSIFGTLHNSVSQYILSDQCYKIMSKIPLQKASNIKHFHDIRFHIIANSYLSSVGVVSKKNIHSFLKRLLTINIKMYFLFSHYIFVWGYLFSCSSVKTEYHNRLNVEADMKIQLSSIRLDMKEICKICETVSFLSLKLFFVCVGKLIKCYLSSNVFKILKRINNLNFLI